MPRRLPTTSRPWRLTRGCSVASGTPLKGAALERKIGEAFYRRGEYAEAMEYLRRALIYFGRPGLPTSPGSVRLGILKEVAVQLSHRMFSKWLVKKIGGPADRTVEEVERIYEIVLSIEGLTAPVAFLHTALMCVNYYERKGYGPGIALNYSCLGFIGFLLSLNRIERFFLPRAVSVAEEIGLPAALIPPHADSAMADFHGGRLQSVIDHASRVRDVFHEAGYPNLLFWTAATCHAAVAHLYLGDLDTAMSLAGELVRTGEDTNDPFIHVCGLWPLNEARDKTGRFQDCIAGHEKAARLNERTRFHDGRVLSGTGASAGYLRLGEMEKSLEALTQADLYRIKHDAKQFTHLVHLGYFRLYLALSERAKEKDRKEWLRKAKQARGKAVHWAKVRPIILPEATRLQGVYDWLMSRRVSAQKHWRRSIALAEEMGMRYELAMTHLEMGKRLNDYEQLEQAEAVFANIGAEFDLREVRRLLEGRSA